jgi:hypothetical protein
MLWKKKEPRLAAASFLGGIKGFLFFFQKHSSVVYFNKIFFYEIKVDFKKNPSTMQSLHF